MLRSVNNAYDNQHSKPSVLIFCSNAYYIRPSSFFFSTGSIFQKEKELAIGSQI